MKNTFRLFVTLFLLVVALSLSKVNAQTNPEDPRFVMTVKNIATTNPANPTRDSILRFEVYVQQINQGQPGVVTTLNIAQANLHGLTTLQYKERKFSSWIIRSRNCITCGFTSAFIPG